MLAREIRAGLIADGERLAPERDMAADLGIAVGTLRKALAELTERGLLEKVQGSGNYVRNEGGVRAIYDFLHLELASGGGLPSAEILSVDLIAKDGLPDFGSSDHALRIRRLRRLNGVDAAVEEIWLDGSYCSAAPASLPDSLYVFYKDELNLLISRAEDSVSVAKVPDWKPAGFGDAPSMWGYVERFGFDQNNIGAEFSRTWFDPMTTRFVARWK